ncbi:MAG: TonB-dependent receptor [Thalassolituus sp.]|uniref:TonB-dependent receptor n=1 Tax=hydrothermal vent metagenome TaxID=652676 RepID=A0A160TDP7_9ZZZZ
MKIKAVFQLTALASAIFAASTFAAENVTEEIIAVGQPIAQANNVTDDSMKEQQSAITSVFASVDNLPGISISEGDTFGSDDWSTTVSMRGYSINLNEQQLGMTVDGIPNGGSNYGGGTKANRLLDGENMQGIEVYQGSGAISSASLDALGGVFNFVSNDPMREENVRVALTNGDYNARRYFVRADSGELMANTFGYVSMSDSFNNRWIGDGSNGNTRRQHIEAKVVSEQKNMNIMGRIVFDNAEEDNYNGVTIAQFEQNPEWDRLTWQWTGDPDIDQNYAEAWSTLRKNLLAYSSIEFFATENLTLTIKPYYHWMKGRGDWLPPYQVNTASGQKAYYTDEDGNLIDENADDACVVKSSISCYPTAKTRVSSYRHTHYDKERFGLLSDAELIINDANTVEGGIWIENNHRPESRDWHEVIDPRVYHHYDFEPYWVQYKNTFDTFTVMPYVQDTMTLGDLEVTLGVKKYFVDMEYTNEFTGNKVSTDSNSDVLPQAGFIYNLTPELELHGSYADNFAAFRDEMLTGSKESLQEVEPEKSTNIDLGLRYNTGATQATVAIYQVDFANRITYISGAAAAGIDYLNEASGAYLNVGGIDSYGIETSVRQMLTTDWDVYASYTYNNSEYKKDVDTDGDGNLDVVGGNKVAASVKNLAVLSLNYSNERYHSSLSTKYTGSRYGDFANADQLDAYTVVDFSLGYAKKVDGGLFKRAAIDLVINNLLDESYLGGGIEGSYFIGAGRTASATLALDF